MTDQERCDRIDELAAAAANLKAGLKENGDPELAAKKPKTPSD